MGGALTCPPIQNFLAFLITSPSVWLHSEQSGLLPRRLFDTNSVSNGYMVSWFITAVMKLWAQLPSGGFNSLKMGWLHSLHWEWYKMFVAYITASEFSNDIYFMCTGVSECSISSLLKWLNVTWAKWNGCVHIQIYKNIQSNHMWLLLIIN